MSTLWRVCKVTSVLKQLVTNKRNMCILFMHIGENDSSSDYKLILASNRDELYDRPAMNISPWKEDPMVIGGRDLEAGCDGGTWLAISPWRKKIGVLLNLPRTQTANAKTRGKIVADYVKSEISTNDYIQHQMAYTKECNGFVFIAIEFGLNVEVKTYSNETDQLKTWQDTCLGFSNSQPETPLKKVTAGKQKLEEICQRLKRTEFQKELVSELLKFLKDEQKNLPDPELEKNRPGTYQQLSSIFVRIPEYRYGTRTHTIVLVTKRGKVSVVEATMEAPIDVCNPRWQTKELEFELCGEL